MRRLIDEGQMSLIFGWLKPQKALILGHRLKHR